MWVGWVGRTWIYCKTCLHSDNKDQQGDVDFQGVSGCAVSRGGSLLTKSVDVGYKQTDLSFEFERGNFLRGFLSLS